MLKKIVIFDLDGTVICSLHRYRLSENGKIDLDHWRENSTPAMISKDSLLPLSNYYKECVADPSVYTVIATARVMEKPDYDFVKTRLGNPDKIVSRPAGSTEKGAILKAKGLAFLRQLKQFRDLPGEFHEDNADYLFHICKTFGYNGYFHPSEQGH